MITSTISGCSTIIRMRAGGYAEVRACGSSDNDTGDKAWGLRTVADLATHPRSAQARNVMLVVDDNADIDELLRVVALAVNQSPFRTGHER